MKDYGKIAETYMRAFTIAREAYEKFPGEVESAIAGIEEQWRNGDKDRAAVDLRRFVTEIVNPLAFSIRARLDQAHKEMMEILKLRLELLEFLHTLASEHEQFGKCAQFAAEMEALNRFLLEDFLVSLDDGQQPA